MVTVRRLRKGSARANDFQKTKNKGGKVSKESVVLRRWESIAGNLELTTELKT